MIGAGHNVRIIAGRGHAFDRRIRFISIPLVDSQHSRIVRVKATLDTSQVPNSFQSLSREIAVRLKDSLRGAEIVFAHNVCSLHKNLPLTAALQSIVEQPKGPRLVAWTHDLAATSERYRGELHLGFPWDLLAERWSNTEYVTISGPRRSELANQLGIPESRIRVIPNGIDADRFLRLGEHAMRLAGEFKLYQASPLILLPVRITKRKNIELALRSMVELRKKMPSSILVITGPPGPHNSANAAYFNQLKQMQAELGLETSVHFLADHTAGQLSNETVADLFRLSDAVLITSREEGFGIPILEAGLTGLPIFCTDIPALHELGQQDVHYFSPQTTPAEIADLILSELKNDQEYRLRSRVKRDFSWNNIYEHHLKPLLKI
jgi:glycosyltransferase involved in cell wall biosynthesis